MNMGGVATPGFFPCRIHSKREMSRSSKIATSPSRISVSGASARIDFTRSGNRFVWSRPCRLTSRTWSPSLNASIRQPSIFSSKAQPSRWKGRARSVCCITAIAAAAVLLQEGVEGGEEFGHTQSGLGPGKSRGLRDGVDLCAMEVEMEADERQPLIRVPRTRDRMRRDHFVWVQPEEPLRQGVNQRLVALESEHPIVQWSAATWPRQVRRLLSRHPGHFHDVLNCPPEMDRRPGPHGLTSPESLRSIPDAIHTALLCQDEMFNVLRDRPDARCRLERGLG